MISQQSILEILQVIREAQAVNQAETQAVVRAVAVQAVVVRAVAVQTTVALSSKEANHEHIKK